jgi:uncharacterized RDD family membrane protein YckC
MDIEEKLQREGFIPSTFSKRVYAYTIDELLVSLIIFAAFFNQFVAVSGDIMAIISLTNSMILYFIILKTAYHTIFIHLYGKTIGKMMARIRAIDIYTLDNPSWKDSFIRAIIRNFDEMFFYLGMLYALTNPLTQTIHDKFSKVVVIDD